MEKKAEKKGLNLHNLKGEYVKFTCGLNKIQYEGRAYYAGNNRLKIDGLHYLISIGFINPNSFIILKPAEGKQQKADINYKIKNKRAQRNYTRPISSGRKEVVVTQSDIESIVGEDAREERI